MSQRTLRCFPATISVAVALALSGCGGGGSSTTPDGDTGSGMTGGTGGTGSGMTGDPTLTIQDGLARSTATPVHASNANDTLATLLPDSANRFAPLTSAVEVDYGTSSAATSESHIKTISSDGNNGFHVTYVVGGDERMIHFEEVDYVVEDGNYQTEVDGISYWLWTYTDSHRGTDRNRGSFRYKYVDVNGFFGYHTEDNFEDGGTGDWNYLSYGARTGAANLPAGSAMYEGIVDADSHLKTDPTRTHRERMKGVLHLTANFDDSTLDGMVLGIRVRVRNQNDDGWNEWAALPDTTHFEVADGQIADGQFSATLTGVDSNSGATPQETVSGYEGGILGEFYGPGAEEIGGVLNANRQDRVLGGVFAGKQVDPDATGLNRSTAGPVHATSASDTYEVLSDQGSRFAPLTSALQRDWDILSTKRIDSYYVKTTWIEGDLAGGTGVLHVTYVVDGREQTVEFEAGEYTPGEGFMTEKGADRYWLWSLTDSFEGGSGYRYLDSYGFDYSPRGTGVNNKTFIAFGARTESGSLPAGSATYSGRMRADTYKQNDPSQSFRYRMYGDLSITANFDASTLGGTISGIHVRGQSETSRSPLSATAQFEIGNGQIADGQFTATLTGMDSDAAVPLQDTVRGYQGDVLGEFYGPEAEEIGGVLTAVRDEDQRIMSGAFIGRKQ